MDYSFARPISEPERLAELHANLQRGNHKSATSKQATVNRLLAKDVSHGFSLPFDPQVIPEIPNAMVQPCGIVRQFTLEPDGSRVPKDRLTQDLSFSCSQPGVSVNDRIDHSSYPELIYGWCLSRTIHFIVSLRLAHPTTPILIAKYDFSDAYRRIAHSAQAAAQSLLVVNDIAYMALRLTFGGSPNPAAWSAFSEMVTDLSNELPLIPDWDHTTLFNPDQPTFTGPPKPPSEDLPQQAQPLAVSIPTSVKARSDCFIDDIIRIMLLNANLHRNSSSVPLAVHSLMRPHAGDSEPIPRRPILQPKKLLAEGTPAFRQIVLGWLLDTHKLSISLPFDKFTAWTNDIQQILDNKASTFANLESLIGRLNHAAFVIPLSRHFLHRLRSRLSTPVHKHQVLRLSSDEIQDLHLWLKYLQLAHDSISLNLLTLREPQMLGISDSCPFGLGGFTWSGRAWRLRVPPSSPLFGDCVANNFLEFLAMAITIWLMILECNERGLEHQCLLSLGDNTSAISWLFKLKHKPNSIYYKACMFVARQIATLFITNHHCLFSQHLQGVFNIVADFLSFEGNLRTTETDGKLHPLAFDHPSNDLLTQRFHTHLHQLIPQHFKISPLPPEIASFVTAAMQIAESSWIQHKKQPLKAEIVPGAGTPTSSNTWALSTHSSMTYPQQTKTSSCGPSSPVLDIPSSQSAEQFLESLRNRWQARLSAVPQAVWLRRSGTTSGQAPFTTRQGPTSSPPSEDS